MALTDMLVHVDYTKASAGRVRAAQELAERFDAHITGLYVSRPVTIPVYTEVPIPVEVMDEAKTREKEMAEHAREEFERIMSPWKSKIAWYSEEGDAASVLVKHAPYYDLVVIGQFDQGDENDTNWGVADRVPLESGRPVLIIPSGGARGDIGKRIMVAWNGKREAARAIHDALPFLKRSDAVIVASVDAPKGADVPGADMAEHLARHGITVETRQAGTDGANVGTALLSLAEAQGTDLMVMGAYGHSRLREMVLGGTTRQVLSAMTIPVLMTH